MCSNQSYFFWAENHWNITYGLSRKRGSEYEAGRTRQQIVWVFSVVVDMDSANSLVQFQEGGYRLFRESEPLPILNAGRMSENMLFYHIHPSSPLPGIAP